MTYGSHPCGENSITYREVQALCHPPETSVTLHVSSTEILKTTTTKRVSLSFPLKFHQNMTKGYFILFVVLRIHCLSELKDPQFLPTLEISPLYYFAFPPGSLFSPCRTPIMYAHMPDSLFFFMSLTILSFLYLLISPWWISCSYLKPIFPLTNSLLSCI